ncbi:hypothetical protein ABZ703_43070, partial [Streptomyces massasporeus]
MIGRLFSLVIDCPDPSELAGFYEVMLSLPRVVDTTDYVVIQNTTGTDRHRLDHGPRRRRALACPRPLV